MTHRSVKVKDRTLVVWVSTADIILPKLAPEEGLSASVQVLSSVVGMADRTSYPEPKRDASEEELQMLLSKLDLSRIEDWADEDQQEVRKLLAEHANLFALH